jgi:hypothetical protein
MADFTIPGEGSQPELENNGKITLSTLSQLSQATEAVAFTSRLANAGYALYEDDLDELNQPRKAAELREGCELYAFCPLHESNGVHDPSLSVKLLAGKVLAYCHVCCESPFTQIMAGSIPECTATYQAGDVADVNNHRSGGGGKLVASIEIGESSARYAAWCQQHADGITDITYYYGGESTAEFAKVRWQSIDNGTKAFRCYQRPRFENRQFGSWRRSKQSDQKNLRVPLYGAWRLGEFPGQIVIAVEGEKDTNALLSLGIPAVSTVWIGTPDLECLRGRRVAVIPDNDEAGRGVAERFQRAASKISAFAIVMNPLSNTPKSDVSDWLEEGHTSNELLVTVEAAFITASDNGGNNGDGNGMGDGGNGNDDNDNGIGGNDGGEEPPGRNDWQLACRLAGDERYRLPASTAAGDTFFLNRDGIEREWEDTHNNDHVERIAIQPFVVSKVLRSDTGVVQCELSWLTLGNEIRCRTVAWSDLTGNKLTAVFGGDAVVIDRHRNACAEYIQELIVINRSILAEKEERVATSLGWRDDGSEFVLGPRRPCQISDSKNLGSWLEGWEKAGDYRAWRQMVECCANQPIALLMLAASFTPPLLRILRLASFAFDVSGVSSSGKTTGMELAVSPWGDPRRVMRGWNDTSIANEHYLSVLRGMPYFLNESQLVDDPKHVSSLVYALAEGRSKSRSRQDGTGNTENSGITFESVLISCGENSLASFVKKGGLAPRIVTIEGKPMESAAMANSVHESALMNYGHAGELFIAALQHYNDDRLKTRHNELEAGLRNHTVTDVAGRRAANVAAMRLANEIAAAAGLMPALVPEIWVHLANGGGALDEHADDLPMQALMALASEVAVNPLAFWVIEGGMSVSGVRPGDIPPPGGWAGRYHATGDKPFVSVAPKWLKAFLEQQKHDYDRTVKTWRDRGWLQHSPGVLTYPVRINGKLARMVTVTCNELMSTITGSDWTAAASHDRLGMSDN